jgi:hypothetical protein
MPAPLQGAPINSETQGVALGWSPAALSAPQSESGKSQFTSLAGQRWFRRTGFSLSDFSRYAAEVNTTQTLKPVLLAPRNERVAANLGDRCRSGLRHSDLQLPSQNLDHRFYAFLPE